MQDANGNNRIETIELWHWNPVEYIAELLGNPYSHGKQEYAPRWVFRNSNGTNQEYGEMWTADWWWKTQVHELNTKKKLRKAYFSDRNYCLLVQLLSLSSSHLTRLSSQHSVGINKLAVYLTIGNIEKCTHQKPSTHATILLGYIPVSKLENFSKEHHSVEGYQIFHDSMKIMLGPMALTWVVQMDSFKTYFPYCQHISLNTQNSVLLHVAKRTHAQFVLSNQRREVNRSIQSSIMLRQQFVF